MEKYAKKKIKALLVSMPWIDYQLPSLQVGCLAAYVRQKGFDVKGLHLHLEAAALFGLKEYDKISFNNNNMGELLFAIGLFPEREQCILKYLKGYITNPEDSFSRLSHVIRQIYRNINWRKYDLIGFTVNYEQLFASLLFAKWIRRDFPKIKIVLGGPHVSGELGVGTLKCFPQVDWCIDGEGETAFTELLDCISKGIEAIEDHVSGLIYRHNGDVQRNKQRELSNLKNLPDPDFDHYFQLLDHYPLLQKKSKKPYLPIESSRGCPFDCAFCSYGFYWLRYRIRPPHEVARQLKRLSNRYRCNNFRFVDNLVPLKYIKSLFSAIRKQRRDYSIFYEIRADIKKRDIEIMSQTGVDTVQIGIEALSTALLKKMNKRTRVIENLETMKFCEEFGIKHNSNLIIGFPTETQRNIDETIQNIDYASAYCPPSDLVPFSLEYGAPIFKDTKKYKISKICNVEPFNYILPIKISKVFSYMVKSFRSNKKRCKYHDLKERHNRWCNEWRMVISDNKKLLCYYDVEDFLILEDRRAGLGRGATKHEIVTMIRLEKEARQLYLFCDSIKSWDEIKKCFPKWDEKEIKKVLNKLVKLKVMFREDDDYLSLAIRANGPR